MTIAFAWVVALVAFPAAVWVVAGLLLSCRDEARGAATTLAPVALQTVVVWYLLTGGFKAVATSEEVHWRVVFAVVSLLVGSFAVLPAAPVWLLMESRFGDRAA